MSIAWAGGRPDRTLETPALRWQKNRMIRNCVPESIKNWKKIWVLAKIKLKIVLLRVENFTNFGIFALRIIANAHILLSFIVGTSIA